MIEHVQRKSLTDWT